MEPARSNRFPSRCPLFLRQRCSAACFLACCAARFLSAHVALDSGSLDFDTCFQLLREVLHPKGPTYFNFGACPSIKSGCCSLYVCSPEQEDLVRFLDALLLRFFPDKSWACLWVNFDCKKLPHRDSQSAEGSENFTFSLGNFSGEGLWLHAPAGNASSSTLVPPPPPAAIADLPGALCQVVDTNRRPFAFPASALHATMPWTGHRWLVTGYSCQCLSALSAADSAIVRGWGLPLPNASAGTRISPACPQSFPPSAELQHISQKPVGGCRMFVDVCCGSTRPLCAPFEAMHLPVLPVDLLQDVPLDLLSDDVFDTVIRLCFSGQVGLMHASPPCKKYSRLKLRPAVLCLSAVCNFWSAPSRGGQSDLEQPTNG